jgi:hypothetical protein
VLAFAAYAINVPAVKVSFESLSTATHLIRDIITERGVTIESFTTTT